MSFCLVWYSTASSRSIQSLQDLGRQEIRVNPWQLPHPRSTGRRGMGVLFKAEALAAAPASRIKLVAGSQQQDPEILQRYFIEMRTIAQLQHPNIVAALDAGKRRVS